MEQKPFLEDKLVDPQGLVVDKLQDWVLRENPVGYAVMGWPREMFVVLDYTALRGSASNVFWTFTHRVGKMRYNIAKVDEWVEVNPNYVDLYNQLIGQKQRLEGAIKSSLGSVAQAVADYELMRHDARRYGEMLDYFKKGQKDQHVMRSLFVDRVDAFTGEGYSLVTMAKRWPTIITDFIRMKEELEDVGEIRKDLDVSQAEATVLKTKNELFKEWKKMFLPTVKERYARIQTLVKARQRSIDEYKKWLKPYLAKYKSMKEGTEKGDWSYVDNAFSTPGFGTMDAWTFIRVWVWRPFNVVEAGKPEGLLGKGPEGKFMVDPYDDFVRHWKKEIEKHYDVTITDEDVKEILKKAVDPRQAETGHCTKMESQAMYYLLFDMKIILSTMKSPPPEGVEMDNLMYYPLKIWVMSQNSLLIHLLELHARQKWMDRYMDEIIGARTIEEDIYRKVEVELGERKAEDKKEKGERFLDRIRPRYATVVDKKTGKTDFKPNLMMRFVRFFVKPGPYEPVFFERLSKMYFRASGFYYKQMVDVIKGAMGIE
jgi:hypothetical protein